jgi:deoxyhypusine synthase
MPTYKQEQYIGELIARAKHRETLTAQERFLEDEEMRELSESFNAIVETMDQMQKQIVVSQMGNLLPSGQVQYMRQLVDGGVDELLPPSEDEVKEWKTFYLQYFNASKS